MRQNVTVSQATSPERSRERSQSGRTQTGHTQTGHTQPGRAQSRRAVMSVPVYLLRGAALLIPLYIYYAQLPDLVMPVPLFAAWALALLLPPLLQRLRLIPALVVLALLPWILRLVLLVYLGLQSLLIADPRIAAQVLMADSVLMPLLPAFYLVAGLSLMSARGPRLIGLEAVLQLVVLGLLMWNQANYRVTVVPHPSLAAGLVAAFVLLHLAAMILQGREPALSSTPASSASGTGKAAHRQARTGADRSGGDLRQGAAYLFVLLPIVLIATFFSLRNFSEQSARAGGGLIQSNLFQFDFSDYVSLESEISLNRDLVMLYRREGKARRELLRRYVMSGYDADRGFYLDDTMVTQPTRVPDHPVDIPQRSYRAREELRQEYFIVNFDPASLIALADPVRVTPLRNWRESSFARVYEVLSSVSDARGAELVGAPEPRRGLEWMDYYTDYGGDERIRGLAEQIAGDAPTPYDAAQDILRHLKTEYYYSLTPGLSSDGNQLHHFLFESRKGYCSYYAFSMSLMLRSLGIPSRVAVGFFVDPNMDLLNFYPVRADQAHAWTEVYFEDYGWVSFDPTSQQLAPGESFAPPGAGNNEELAALLEEILNNQSSLVPELQLEQPGVTASESPDARPLVDFLLRTWPYLLPAVYLGLRAAYQARFAVRRLLLLRSAAARPGTASRMALLYLQQTERLLSRVGLGRESGQTPQEWASRLADLPVLAPAVLKIVHGYTEARFSQHPDLAGIMDLGRAGLTAYRQSVPIHVRLIAWLIPGLDLSRILPAALKTLQAEEVLRS